MSPECLEKRVNALEIAQTEDRVRMVERQEVLKLTAEALKDKMHLLNELRSDVMTKSEYLRAHESLIFRIEKVEQMQSRFIGVAIAFVALGGFVGALIAHLVK